MERSNFANVLLTTRVLPYLSSENLEQIKSCIVAEFGCKNEAEFLSKILKEMYWSLSNKSIKTIKDKAIQLADSQPMIMAVKTKSQDDENDHDHDNTSINNSKTVCRCIEETYNDALSCLSSDIIDCIGSFLTKPESIELGYLNKQLYIETQKLSYLLKRCKDNTTRQPLILNDTLFNQLLLPVNNSYNYNFPTHLCIDIYEKNINIATQTKNGNNNNNNNNKNNKYGLNKMMHHQELFPNFFLRLNYLSCQTLESLIHIPIEILFNKKSNFYENNESRDYIKKFSIETDLVDENDYKQEIEILYQRFLQYKKDNDETRKIDTFEFNIHKSSIIISSDSFDDNDEDNSDWKIGESLKKLFLLLCSLSKSCIVGCSIDRLGICNFDELTRMFHSDLKCFGIKSGAFGIDHEIPHASNAPNASNATKEDEIININTSGASNSKNSTSNLEEIMIDMDGDNNDEQVVGEQLESAFNTLDFLDKLEITRNVRKCMINWGSFSMQEATDEAINHFFILCRRYPLLEKVTFKINSGSGLKALLSCFKANRKELFVEKQMGLVLKYFQTIELQFSDEFVYVYVKASQSHLTDDLQRYPVNERIIKIVNVDQCLNNVVGRIYDWFQRIRDAKQSIGGRRIVLML